MKDSKKINAHPFRWERYIWWVPVAWTMVILASLLWNMIHLREMTLKIAHLEAKLSLEKDVVYRDWIGKHSVVYVAVTEETPPNPYLSHISERDITTPSGRRLTLMNPEYMTRQIYDLTKKKYSAYIRTTSLNPLRPENSPDLWEAKTLETIEREEKDISSVEKIEQKDYFRLMRPLITEGECLKCHAKDGYKEGDIRGGISVAIPMEPLWAFERSQKKMYALVHFLIWLVGLTGIVIGMRKIKENERVRREAEESLQEAYAEVEQKVEERTAKLRVINESLEKEISKRKRVEEEAIKLQNAVHQIADILFITDRNGNIEYVNPSFEKITGYCREEAIGKTPRILKSGLMSAEHYKDVWSTIRSGKVLRAEVTNKKKDGEIFIYDQAITPLKDPQGNIAHFISTGRDITEQKRAEEELKRNYDVQKVVNSVLHLSLENIPFEKLLRHTLDLILSLPWLSFESRGAIFFVEEDPEILVMKAQKDLAEPIQKKCNRVPFGRCLCGRAALTQVIQFADSLDERHENVYEGITSHGHHCVPILFAGRTLGVICVYLKEGHHRNQQEEDFLTAIANTLAGIIVRRRTEEELRQSQQKFEGLVNSTDGMIWEADAKTFRFSFMSKQSERILGYPVNLWIQEQTFWRDHIHPDDRDWAVSLCITATSEKRPHQFEYRMIAADGRIVWVRDIVTVIVENDQPVKLQGIMVDITERKQLEEQLHQSQKMEAIGKLAGGIAHDFNNLLTVIKGYSQLSLLDLKEDDPLKGNIEEIQSATDRASNLTRQILAFSRRQVMEMGVFDLDSLLKDLDKMLRRLIGEDIEIVSVMADDLGRVKADPGQIEQVIMNLGVNARDAMPGGGKLTIETANVELDEEYARKHVAVTPGRYVMLSVSDTGVGMTPEVKEKIFEPFFTTKERGKGTGLGLSTVYGIVKQSGGNIWVYSEPGRGTTFKIYLPRVDEPLDEVKKEVVEGELPRGNETIIVVEDEEEVRRLAVEILRRQGYKVLEASQGLDAFHICEEHECPIHLLLTDVVMPRMSGRELADRAAEIYPEIKVLYMSGYTDNAIVRHGVLEKGMNFIQKPFTMNGLVRKVREVLDLPQKVKK
ncbi:MAG: PAS domain S-box protein [Thermodesulfobacteriota bacterium]|nr:PAS domain S-box protein [Thermodesulfobacteriota bacterium]